MASIQTTLSILRAIPPAYKWMQEQFPLKHFDRIGFGTRIGRESAATLKLKFYIDITNDRSSPVVLSSAFFTFKTISVFRFDPQIARDTASGRYHCKFLNDKKDAHNEISYLLRPGFATTSYIALEPSHMDSDIRSMLTQKSFGTFNVYITWWTDKEVPKTRLVTVDLS